MAAVIAADPRRRRGRPSPSQLARLSCYLGGLFVAAAGLALLIDADLGLPPWDVLIFGLAGRTGLSPVVTRMLVVGAVVAAVRLLGGRRVLVGMLVPLVFGPAVELWIAVVPDPDLLAVRVAMVAGGVIALGVGVGVYLAAELPAGPIDLLGVLVAERFRPPFWAVRTGLEVAALVAGWAVGGGVGLGTAAFALGAGPVVQVALERTRPLLPTPGKSPVSIEVDDPAEPPVTPPAVPAGPDVTVSPALP